MSKIIGDPIYKRMWKRERFRKRTVFVIITFAITFYLVFIFANLKIQALHLIDLNRCPVCYGMSVCPELHSNQILANEHRWHHLFSSNVKNIYHGYTKFNRKVILKKLAFDRQLDKLDNNLCKTFNLYSNCKLTDLLKVTSSNIYTKIIDLVRYNLTRKAINQQRPIGFIFCPYPERIYEFLKPIFNYKIRKWNQSDLLNIWTMLRVNAEPIILQVLPKSKGWPVPAYVGVCGRLEVVTDEGITLANLGHIAWYRKLKIAKQILAMAMDFTFKHDRYRFYFFDWIDDNIVVNEKDQVSLIDLEDVIVLDKNVTPSQDLLNWYEPSDGYKYAEYSICQRHLSDHNIYSACFLLMGDENAKPFLNPIPKHLEVGYFRNLVNQCLYGSNKFAAAILLQQYMTDLLSEENDTISLS